MSFDIILPFLRPIAHLIQDPDVSEIMVNGGGRVFLERQGQLEEAEDVHILERNLQVAVRNIARTLGDDMSEEPILDARLPDGSRVAAVIPPCSLGGTTLTIRKFHSRFFTVDELVRIGALSPNVLKPVRDAIERRQNILISGGTSTGKTTLLKSFCFAASTSDAPATDSAGRRDSRHDRRRTTRDPPSVARLAVENIGSAGGGSRDGGATP